MIPLRSSPLLLFLLSPLLVAAQNDEQGLLETWSFDWGTFSIFGTWVALFSICVGQYRQAAELNDNWNQSDERVLQARRAILHGTMEAIFIFTCLIVLIAVVIPLLTKNLDERMWQLKQAFSRLLSAVIQAMLSLRVAIWLDLYGHPFWKPDSTLNKKLGTTITELTHRVRWSISRRFLRMYFLLWVCFQGVDAATIPLSIIFGLLWGAFIDFGIYLCRRWVSVYRRGCISFCFVVFLIAASILQFTSGILFIAAVWEEDVEDPMDATWDIYAFFIALVGLPLIHLIVYLLGRRNRITIEEAEAEREPELDENGNPTDAASKRPQLRQARMATSMIFSDLNIMKKIKKSQTETENDVANIIIQEGDEDEEDDSNNNNNNNNKDNSTSNSEKSEGVEAPEAPLPSNAEGGSSTNIEGEVEMVHEEVQTVEAPEAPIPTNGEGEASIPPNVEGGEVDMVHKEVQTVESGKEPSLWSLMMDWQCCGCARGGDKTTGHKIANVIIWILYLAICAICVFSLICNAGSTYQQDRTSEKLPFVGVALYNTMDEGPVCAYDAAVGTEGPEPTTFPDKDAAHDAGFSILHCGACNHCSDWHNLELEYTTRKFLAEESKNCAQKSLFGGGYDVLVECLENPVKIGFQGTCAICWADDILCTKAHCWAIGLQSFLINTISNFAVEEGTITSAACEEGNCEADNPTKPAPAETAWWGKFVECSGANRRRMAVESTIDRPGTQQCGIVDVVWDEVFPDLHPNDPDYKEL